MNAVGNFCTSRYIIVISKRVVDLESTEHSLNAVIESKRLMSWLN